MKVIICLCCTFLQLHSYNDVKVFNESVRVRSHTTYDNTLFAWGCALDVSVASERTQY